MSQPPKPPCPLCNPPTAQPGCAVMVMEIPILKGEQTVVHATFRVSSNGSVQVTQSADPLPPNSPAPEGDEA